MRQDQIVQVSAIELLAAMDRGEVSATEVMEAFLERIEALNPTINAIVDFQPEQALQQAWDLDAAGLEGRRGKPLAGLPIAVKDLIPAAGFRFVQGSPVFADRVADVDAAIVARMKAAGAIVVGKTNTPEFGLGSHTFNPVYGVTRNPYDLTKTAGGSSGGAAAALAARMLPLADGSDTGGSLRNPASFCNVVGLRPSIGRVPSWPDSYSFGRLSVKGPMGRSVRDVALLLSVQAGEDHRHPYSTPADTDAYLAVAASEPGSVLGKERLKVGWTADFGGSFPVAREVLAVVEPVLKRLGEEGWQVEDSYPDLSGAGEVFRAARGLQMLASLGPVAAEHADQMKEDALWNVQAGRDLTGEQVAAAEVGQSRIFTAMRTFLDDHDLLITPTCQVVPFDVSTRFPREIDGVAMNDYLEWMSLPYYITVTGHPAISIPVGFTPSGLPVGLQVVGPYRREDLLLEYAKRIEDLVGSWQTAPDVPTGGVWDRFPEIN